MSQSIHTEADMEALCHAAAKQLVELILAKDGDFNIALAGGSTPKRLYQLLASAPYADQIPWQRMRIFFGDERSVGPDDSESNYRMAHDALLAHVPIAKDRIHRIHGEQSPIQDAASDYASVLKQYLPFDDACVLQFDMVLLGLGPDGHIASLFPGTDALTITDAATAAVWVEKFNTWRVSITYPLINHARRVWLFVAGASKAEIIDEIFNQAPQQPPYPVQAIQAENELCWFLDEAAAKELSL